MGRRRLRRRPRRSGLTALYGTVEAGIVAGAVVVGSVGGTVVAGGGLVVGGTVVSGGACVVGVVVSTGGEVGSGLGEGDAVPVFRGGAVATTRG